MSDEQKPFYKSIWFWIALIAIILLIYSNATKPGSAISSTRQNFATQDEKTEIVYITKTGEKYHRAGCRYLSKSQIAIELDDAVARGYEPCSVCKP